MMGYNCWYWGPGYFFGFPLGMIVGIVFWVLIMYGIFYLISYMARCRSGSVRKEEIPLEILKRLYAKGGIDAEEFSKRKKVLES